MRQIYMQSLNTFIIEKRNLTELVTEMANYTNRAIMKKLEAIRNLVNISEQSYRRFEETDEKSRNETAEYMKVSTSLSREISLDLLSIALVAWISELQGCPERDDQRHAREWLCPYDSEHYGSTDEQRE